MLLRLVGTISLIKPRLSLSNGALSIPIMGFSVFMDDTLRRTQLLIRFMSTDFQRCVTGSSSGLSPYGIKRTRRRGLILGKRSMSMLAGQVRRN